MASTQRIRVPLTKNKKYVRSGPKSYASALAKFNINPTQPGPYFRSHQVQHQGKHGAAKAGRTSVQQNVLMKRVAATDAGEQVPATDIQGDAEYLCSVSIGTPAQTLSLDFDTGSSDLWVWSTGLPSSVTSKYGSSHTIFDSSKSSSFKASSGSSWQISYGDGSSSSGTVGTDDVTIGNITIKAQAVELADTISDSFQSGAGDGLLGLAWPAINTVKPQPVATPVENMITQNDIPKDAELFTAWLGSAADAQGTESNSFYTFGFIDSDALQTTGVAGSAIAYTPVDNSQGFWQFASASTTVNGKAVAQSGNTAIADTGTTLALVSDDVCKAVYAAIPGAKYDSTQQGYTFPTSTAASALPTVQVSVGDQLYTIHKEALAFADAGDGNSYGGIQSRGDMTFDILGDVFLRGVYAVFDQGNTRFGAVARPETTTGGSTSGSTTTK